MNTNEIKEILVQRGYNENRAELVSRELIKIDPELIKPLNDWLKEGIETELEYQGVSLLHIMQRGKLTYPAALLSIDWIYKDAEKALPILKRVGMKTI